MTETTPSRRAVPLWAQITIWIFLVGLLIIIAMGLNRAQQGTVQPGQQIADFKLTFYDNYRINENAEINLSDLRGKVVMINF
ncbi:MAG TPA: hypothetical protein PLM89_01980, partial [Anaerolineales bacterium]|nr:hypothetical protein [Anaerolineales bacterium]